MAMRGDANQAFAWIDKALAQSPFALNGASQDPTLAKMRSNLRWLPALSALGQAPEQLPAITFDVVVPAPR